MKSIYKHIQKPAEQLTGDGVVVPLAAVELADYLGKIGSTRPQIATETQRGLLEGPRSTSSNSPLEQPPPRITKPSRD
jgi:hypothetical protein